MRFLLFLVATCLLLGCGGTRSANPGTAAFTTVYLVRHAEKDLTPGAPDPDLTPAGRQRAETLRERLETDTIAAIFTTDTRRTRATIAPLATALQLPPVVYDADKHRSLAAQIRKEYRGKTVVVVGHSNTLLPLLQELGATPPVARIGDDEYGYLFEVRIPLSGRPPTVTMRHYGK